MTNPLDTGTVPVRDRLEVWVRDFLRRYADAGMSDAEAAEIICGAVETCLQDHSTGATFPLADVEERLRFLETI